MFNVFSIQLFRFLITPEIGTNSKADKRSNDIMTNPQKSNREYESPNWKETRGSNWNGAQFSLEIAPDGTHSWSGWGDVWQKAFHALEETGYQRGGL